MSFDEYPSSILTQQKKPESWKQFLYNNETSEFLGRTASSWGEVKKIINATHIYSSLHFLQLKSSLSMRYFTASWSASPLDTMPCSICQLIHFNQNISWAKAASEIIQVWDTGQLLLTLLLSQKDTSIHSTRLKKRKISNGFYSWTIFSLASGPTFHSFYQVKT